MPGLSAVLDHILVFFSAFFGQQNLSKHSRYTYLPNVILKKKFKKNVDIIDTIWEKNRLSMGRRPAEGIFTG